MGQEMLRVLEEYDFPVTELIPVASPRSIGSKVRFKGAEHLVISLKDGLEKTPDLALFSAGGSVSREWAPKFANRGCWVIDNSSAWRMDAKVPLIVPEVNAAALQDYTGKIIANPNCSTIQLVVALAPLAERYGLRRVVVCTYQSITGTGKKAVDQMVAERNNELAEMVYPHPIDQNCLPHCDTFQENGYTREELKVVNESRKILGLPQLRITCTAVRVPVVGGHSEAVNVELDQPFELHQVRELLQNARGIRVLDTPEENLYPMPILVHGKNETYVGRLRRDESLENGLHLWVVADNLRKGAATNSVQIAQALVKAGAIAKASLQN